MMKRTLEPSEALRDNDADICVAVSKKHSRWVDRPFLRKAMAMAAGRRQALDIGCGNGHIAIELATYCPDLNVFAMDLSEDMVEAVRQNAATARVGDRVAPVLGDAVRLPFPDNSVDLVLSLHAVHHFPDPQSALREIRRVLAPNGAALIRDVRRPRTPLLASLLANGFGFLLRYGADVRRKYLESLHAALTAKELETAARAAGLEGFRVVQEQWHHVDLTIPACPAPATGILHAKPNN